MGGSSSHRRRNRRFSPRRRTNGPAPALTTDLTFAHLTITTGVGYNLLLKSGWQPGSPLSQSPPSDRQPLPLRMKQGRGGLGSCPTPSSPPSSSVGAVDIPQPTSHGRFDLPLADPVGSLLSDPLRPRCRFDHAHVVPNLRALRKHELSCPANPNRGAPVVDALMAHMSLEDLQDEVGEDEDDISDISSESESDSGSESDGLSGDDVRRGLGFGGFAA